MSKRWTLPLDVRARIATERAAFLARFPMPPGSRVWTCRGRTFYHRLWHGPKKLSRFWFDARTLDDMERKSSFKVGDLAGDCDFFNHRITKIEPWYQPVHRWKSLPLSKRNHRARFLYEFTFYRESVWAEFRDNREDDHCFCSCSVSPCYPWPRDKIEKELFEVLDFNLSTTDESGKRMHATLAAGGHVCDEDGVQLPEFVPKHADRNKDHDVVCVNNQETP